MTTDLDDLLLRGEAAFAAAATLEALDAVKAELVGRSGELTLVQRGLGQLDADARKTLGAQVNQVRERFTAAEARRRTELEEERDRVTLAAEAVDVTLPPRTPKRGRLHPIAETMEVMIDALVALGYTAVRGPEVESEWFNFDALNMPADHPSRGLSDTIYVESLVGGTPRPLLRTQTSPMQVRIMLAQPPPVYVAVPGRVYRPDTPDATHLPVFHQIEGLAVDRDLSFADLRGTLAAFTRALLGPDVRIRLRPHHFTFTEPSAEVDAWYRGQWIELLGCGMVHPNVLGAAGYDPDEVSGFAFGIGVDRVTMLRHDVPDLRLLGDNDLRYLEGF